MPTRTLAMNSDNAVSFNGYLIWDEGIKEDFGRLQPSEFTWTFVCKWTERIAVRALLMGGALLVNGNVTVAAPFRHPSYSFMAVTRAPCEGVDGPNGRTIGSDGFVAYDYARFTTTFSALDANDMGEERVDYAGRILTVPNGTFGFGSGTSRTVLLAAESPGVVIPRVTLQRTVNSQPRIPTTLIFSLLGKVNAASFQGAPAETVLFMGACSQRYWTTAGAKQWDISYSWVYDGQNWNYFLNPATGNFERLTKANGDGPYLTGDFDQFHIPL